MPSIPLLVDLLHQRAGKSILHAEQHADLLHVILPKEIPLQWTIAPLPTPAEFSVSTLADLFRGCHTSRVKMRPTFRGLTAA